MAFIFSFNPENLESLIWKADFFEVDCFQKWVFFQSEQIDIIVHFH